MAVKLDVLVNYLFDNSKLKANIASLNKQMISAWSPYSRQQILNMGQRGNLIEYFSRLRTSAKQFNDILDNTRSQINALNKKGYFQPYLEAMGIYGRKNLNEEEVQGLSRSVSNQQISEIQAIETQEEKKKEEQFEKNLNQMLAVTREDFFKTLKAEQEEQRQYMANVMSMLSLDTKLAKEELTNKKERKRLDEWLAKEQEAEIDRKSKEDAERLEAEKIAQEEEGKQKKKLFNLMLGRWGKFGLWGIAVAKAIQYASKVMNYAYQTSMQGLDWQRTISGGASGGTWFGQGLAAYQRAGISANAYQGFKRGIQGYMGSVKLGMGNAAPLMYLGISALDKLDDTEKQIEMALRRIGDESVSLSLAQQMGLSYEMWHAIYTGKLDRERDAYSKEAIEKWSKLADGFNEILTKIKTIFFNRGAVVAEEAGEALSAMAGGGVGYRRALQTGSPVFIRSMLDLPGAIASSLIKFGAVEVVVKNEQGEVLGKGESYADVGMQVPIQKGANMDLTQLSSQLKVKTDFNAGSALGLRDINSITGIVDNSVTSLQALIMKNDDPKYDDIDTTNFDVTGITSGYDNIAFIFDLKKEYKLNLSSDITDHYVEDNVAIQDHIGLKPIILDVVGSIGEVNLNAAGKKMNEAKIKSEIFSKKEGKTNIFNAVDSYSNRMGSLTSFVPNIANQARDIYDSAKSVYNTGKKAFNFVKDPTGETNIPKGSGFAYTEKYTENEIYKSEQFYWIDWFKTQWEHRASFSIVTPYGVLRDMYIMELSASQPENTRYVTNLNIKFKQIKKAKVIASEKKVSQKMDIQQSKITDNPGDVNVELSTESQDQITAEVSQEEKVKEAISKAKENPGGVSQVIKEEFEKRRAEVISMNVKGATQNFTPSVGQIQQPMSLFGVGTAVGG